MFISSVAKARQLLALLVLVSISSLIVPAQEQKQTPEDKQRKVKNEPNKPFLQWINDHEVILTQSERDAWKKLQTNEEREKYIEEFWRSRDPDPDTEENEYKEQFYERVAYANEHFSSGKPGRLTDRGRIYIKFGKPDSVESHPTGGSTIVCRRKAAARRRLTHSSAGSIDIFRTSEAASNSSLSIRREAVNSGLRKALTKKTLCYTSAVVQRWRSWPALKLAATD